MEERAKYILIGIVIFYLLVNFRIIRPFGLGEFARSGNFTNFTRPSSQGLV
jgi:hypothetical protein